MQKAVVGDLGVFDGLCSSVKSGSYPVDICSRERIEASSNSSNCICKKNMFPVFLRPRA